MSDIPPPPPPPPKEKTAADMDPFVVAEGQDVPDEGSP